jgi:hypothetical protein
MQTNTKIMRQADDVYDEALFDDCRTFNAHIAFAAAGACLLGSLWKASRAKTTPAEAVLWTCTGLFVYAKLVGVGREAIRTRSACYMRAVVLRQTARRPAPSPKTAN